MNWKQFQKDIKGKVFLIGLSFLNENGIVIEQYQTFGVVEELTDIGLIRIKRKGNSIFQIPYDSKNITKAKEGEYRLKTTGEIVLNPDFLMTWEITTKDMNLEAIKKYGYLPPE